MLFSQAWRARADAEIKALRNDQVGESYELGGGGGRESLKPGGKNHHGE